MSGATGWLLFAMMVMLVADFVARLFRWQLQDMAQLSVFVMMIVIYLGFSRCEEHHEHVGLEFVTKALPERARRALWVFTQSLAVLTICILLYAVAKNAGKAFATNEAIAGAVQIPTWPTKFIMVLGLGVFLVQAILNLFHPPDRDALETSDDAFE
jgi:TRAP-type C4-dicarboxylate transport system permease small subunit